MTLVFPARAPLLRSFQKQHSRVSGYLLPCTLLWTFLSLPHISTRFLADVKVIESWEDGSNRSLDRMKGKYVECCSNPCRIGCYGLKYKGTRRVWTWRGGWWAMLDSSLCLEGMDMSIASLILTSLIDNAWFPYRSDAFPILGRARYS